MPQKEKHPTLPRDLRDNGDQRGLGSDVSQPSHQEESVSLPGYREHRRNSQKRVAVGVALVVVWIAAIWGAPRIDVGAGVHRFVLFCHIAALVLGFGAVLTIDWLGLLWLARRRSLASVLQVAHDVQMLIWVGLAGLLVSGVLLRPDSSSGLTMAKLVAILVVALNGLYLDALIERLSTNQPHWSIWVRAGLSLVISQCGWWVAMVVGYINTTARP
jgi:hypothetical protein